MRELVCDLKPEKGTEKKYLICIIQQEIINLYHCRKQDTRKSHVGSNFGGGKSEAPKHELLSLNCSFSVLINISVFSQGMPTWTHPFVIQIELHLTDHPYIKHNGRAPGGLHAPQYMN